MGYIYILTNPAFPEYTKVGYTHKDVYQRAKELSRFPGVLFDFEVFGYYQTDAKLSDKIVGRLLEGLMPGLENLCRRDFYKVSPMVVFGLLRTVAEFSNTKENLVLVKEGAKEGKRPRFSFDAAGIPRGSEIEFVDDRKVKAIVKNEHNILYQGKTTSLSKLAQELLGIDHPVQGTLYFVYEGEILNDRRNRMEAEGSYGVNYEQPREI